MIMKRMVDAPFLYAKNGQREGVCIEVIIRRSYCKLRSLCKAFIVLTQLHKNIISIWMQVRIIICKSYHSGIFNKLRPKLFLLLTTQVNRSDVGSYRIQCWILSDPMLDLIGSDNPTESYRIPGDGMTSESVGGRSDRIQHQIRSFPIVRSDACRRAFSTIAKTTARKICNI